MSNWIYPRSLLLCIQDRGQSGNCIHLWRSKKQVSTHDSEISQRRSVEKNSNGLHLTSIAFFGPYRAFIRLVDAKWYIDAVNWNKRSWLRLCIEIVARRYSFRCTIWNLYCIMTETSTNRAFYKTCVLLLDSIRRGARWVIWACRVAGLWGCERNGK